MTYYDGNSQYLEEAAQLLRKAAEKVEKTYAEDGYNSTRRCLIEGRERIAMKFAQLAAIERGQIPAELLGDLLARAFHPAG